MMNKIPPPLALRVAAALTILMGTCSIVGTAVSLAHGRFNIDLGFVGIPIGRGLLVGRYSSRWWAITLSGLGVLLLGGIGCWWLYSGEFGSLSLYSREIHADSREHLWLIIAELCLLFLGCATVFFGLRSISVRAWYNADSSSREDGSGWAFPLVLVGMIVGIGDAIRDYISETSLMGLFAVHTQFEFRDAKTAQRIRSVGCSSDGQTFSSNGRRDPLAPHIKFGIQSSEDGITMELTGFSVRPVDVTFTSESYQPAKYTLTAKSPSELTLDMQPLK